MMCFKQTRLRLFAALLVSLVSLVSITITDAQSGTPDAPTATSFTNVMTRLAAPSATPAPTSDAPLITPTATLSPTSASALKPADAQATISNQQAEISALREQLSTQQGDQGATLYALVIVLVGFLLALAVFFGLRRK